MKLTGIIIITVTSIFFNAPSSAGCSEGELRFAFEDLDVKMAFVIFADYAGLKAKIDPSISYSEPMTFDCRPWRQVADDLATKYHLTLKIENGVIHISK